MASVEGREDEVGSSGVLRGEKIACAPLDSAAQLDDWDCFEVVRAATGKGGRVEEIERRQAGQGGRVEVEARGESVAGRVHLLTARMVDTTDGEGDERARVETETQTRGENAFRGKF